MYLTGVENPSVLSGADAVAMTSNHVLDLGGAFPAGTYAILAKAGIAADGGKTVVTVTVTLLREHAVKKDGKDAPVNGRLRLCLYDAATKAETPLDGLEADDATFAGGPVAAFTFTASSAGGLFKARIER